MRPNLHPRLVNGRFGGPGHVFVTHMDVDHVVGFDVEPCHFSRRYESEEERMLAEVEAARRGKTAPAS